MRTRSTILVLLSFLGAGPVWGAGLPDLGAYAGSEACAECHVARHQGWRESYHFSVVRDAREHPEAILGDFSQEDLGFSPGDVEFTIGAHWYQRYAVRVGEELYVYPKVWSVASHRWETQDAWSWKKKPYGTYCIGCHATRHDPETGTLVEHTVGCEACHGPGRAHAQSKGRAAIVNPADWGRDEQDLLCASCHVRGTDPTGTYYFAVGYVPGTDLTDHYVPFRVENGESNREAFLRTFREWSARLGSGPPPACDVCGIQRERPEATAPSLSERCLSCHAYGEDYAAHTKHPGQLKLECLDCHRLIGPEVSPLAGDVHFPDYFQVHRFEVFTANVSDSCGGCHADAAPGDLERFLDEWDHSDHATSD